MESAPLADPDFFEPLTVEPNWPDHWWYLKGEQTLRNGIQAELHKELSRAHPLWGWRPVVVAKCEYNDDILVELCDGRFAIVHLVWHSRVDNQPEIYPHTFMIDSTDDLQAAPSESF